MLCSRTSSVTPWWGFLHEKDEGLQGVRNILWAVGGGGAAAVAGGFTCEDFMNEAFLHMTAGEQQTKVTAHANSMTVYTVRETCEIDFALERGLCSLLVEEVDQCRTWLGLDSVSSPYRDPSVVNFVLKHSKDDQKDDILPVLRKLLETWLMEVVFPRFRETQDIEFKLGDYYDDSTVLIYLERLEGVGGSPAAIAKLGRKLLLCLTV